jgi:isoquinoline 1-oxidoreductase beta subunit
MRRRAFLVATASAAGGLLLGPRLDARAARAGRPPFAPSPFLRIDPDDTVTVIVARAEMGQGARTALAMLVAEELDADWATVRVEQGDLDPRYGEQFAGGSAVIRTSWRPLREAGATARAMLIAAAARRWRTEPGDCRAESGRVLHADGVRSLRYGALAAAASRLPVPRDVPLKSPPTFRVIGSSRRNVDHPAIVTGAARFGLDVRVPGMLYAAVARAPVFGARLGAVRDAAARAVAGVRAVVPIDADAMPPFGENNPRPANGVAVVATSTWAALAGRRALELEWDERGGAAEGTESMRAACLARADAPDRWVRTYGPDLEAALAGASRQLNAEYETPLLAHAPMEPMNCTAHVTDARCVVWAPTQMPEYVATAAQKITGLPAHAITVHVVRMGGAFGRRFYADYAAEAIAVSRALKQPVQVVWTREDDLQHDFYRPAGLHRLRAGVDAAGRIVGWEHRLWNASRGHYLAWAPATPGEELQPGELSRDDYPFMPAPSLRLAYSPISSKIPRGQWRAVENSSNVFVTQSFLDEVAHAAGIDPLTFRLELVGRQRERLDPSSRYDAARMLAVYRLAAEQSDWNRSLGAGWGRGIAGCFANGSYVAQVAEVGVGEGGAVTVRRIVCVVDCGLVVHPEGAAAQVEGAILQGLSAALGEAVTVTGGRVDQRNFDRYRVLRLPQAPRIEVHFIRGSDEPGGLGEPALPPVAPAVANALFGASGRRLRRLPLIDHPEPGSAP